jgi:hypothetical protein
MKIAQKTHEKFIKKYLSEPLADYKKQPTI